MQHNVSLSYNIVKVVLIVDHQNQTLDQILSLVSSLLQCCLLDENMRLWCFSLTTESICSSRHRDRSEIEGVKLMPYICIHHHPVIVLSSKYIFVSMGGLIRLPGLNRIVSLARTVQMTTVLCINRQKKTHQQALVPNGYCHIFSMYTTYRP